MIRPELDTSIPPSSGDTPTDFVAALVVAGNSLSIVVGGDYSPHSTGTCFLFLMNSLIGASVLSLVLSYLVQVYSELRDRNALALSVHRMTNSTGDPAEMLARLVPEGDCSDAASGLLISHARLSLPREAHHFYPLLFSFRFEDPLYAVSRLSFVLLDLVTLIGAALDQEQCGPLAGSGAVTSLRQGAVLLLETLDQNIPTTPKRGDVAEPGRDRQSYATAIDTLARAGVATRPDGCDSYVAESRTREPLIQRVAPTLGYGMDEVDRRPPQMKPTHGSGLGSEDGR